MYYPDLSSYRPGSSYAIENVKCVGWLDAAISYTTGTPPDGFISKMETITATRNTTFDAHAMEMRGYHPCQFCKRNIRLFTEHGDVMLGMSELWLPAGQGFFAAPSLLVHFVREHQYLPPEEFLEAIRLLTTDVHYSGEEVYLELARRPGS